MGISPGETDTLRSPSCRLSWPYSVPFPRSSQHRAVLRLCLCYLTSVSLPLGCELREPGDSGFGPHHGALGGLTTQSPVNVFGMQWADDQMSEAWWSSILITRYVFVQFLLEFCNFENRFDINHWDFHWLPRWNNRDQVYFPSWNSVLNGQKYMKQLYWRVWTSSSEAQWTLRDGK